MIDPNAAPTPTISTNPMFVMPPKKPVPAPAVGTPPIDYSIYTGMSLPQIYAMHPTWGGYGALPAGWDWDEFMRHQPAGYLDPRTHSASGEAIGPDNGFQYTAPTAATAPTPTPSVSDIWHATTPGTNPAARAAPPGNLAAQAAMRAQMIAQQNAAGWQNHPVLSQVFPGAATGTTPQTSVQQKQFAVQPSQAAPTAPTTAPTTADTYFTNPLITPPTTATTAAATAPFIDPKDLHKDAFTLQQASSLMDPQRYQQIRDYVQSLNDNVNRFSGIGGTASGSQASTGLGSVANNSLGFS